MVPLTNAPTARLVTPRTGLYLLYQHVATEFEANIYTPRLCLILQGCKEMSFGGHNFRLRAGDCALVSHDLPIVSRVREAPYLVLLVDIDVAVIRGLYDDVGELTTSAPARALEVHAADSSLLDAVGRYLALADSEIDARVLGPMVAREIHYRLIVSPLGPMLRGLCRENSQTSGIARAIALLRKDFRSPMVVENLARRVGMSVSSFHKHFKAVSAVSPLQYQKELRLLEARRMVISGKASVTRAAFDVGYESVSQFSREYARRFGNPPSHDAPPAAFNSSIS